VSTHLVVIPDTKLIDLNFAVSFGSFYPLQMVQVLLHLKSLLGDSA
jgi:hypothetical protein